LLIDGSNLTNANAISPDGRFIIGYGYNGTDDSFEGYILDTQEGTGTHTEAHTDLPTRYFLEQNYPNPFNPSTVIRYQIPEASHVVLEVYTIPGHRVAVLADHYHMAGSHYVDFDAAHLSSGLYIYRMRTADFSSTRKLTLLR
jgi:hypothetical protein